MNSCVQPEVPYSPFRFSSLACSALHSKQLRSFLTSDPHSPDDLGFHRHVWRVVGGLKWQGGVGHLTAIMRIGGRWWPFRSTLSRTYGVEVSSQCRHCDPIPLQFPGSTVLID